MLKTSYASWLEIDLRAIRHNVEKIQTQTLVLPYQEMAAYYDEKLLVHAKIDTGMRRLGEEHTQTVEDLAQKWNTIVYEPTCGLPGRIPRVYLNE